MIQTQVLPLLCRDADLGAVMLEVGPGPGAATGWLSQQVTSLVAVEADAEAAQALARAHAGTNVEVLARDAGTLPFEDGHFDSAGAFTMLHHIPTAGLQDRLFAETFRVLRSGGVFAGSDSASSIPFRVLHFRDICNPVSPDDLLNRLRASGFSDLHVDIGRGSLRWRAVKP